MLSSRSRIGGLTGGGVMRIGLTAYDVHAAELIELARAADEAGFDSLWLGEHIVLPIGYDTPHPTKQQPGVQHHTGPIVSPETELVDPLLNLGAAAAVTNRLRLATGIYVLPAAPSTGDRQIDVHAAGDRPRTVHVRRRFRLADRGVRRARSAVRRAGHPLRRDDRGPPRRVGRRRGAPRGPPLLRSPASR